MPRTGTKRNAGGEPHAAAVDVSWVEEELRRRIMFLELPPGASVTHAYLAQQLGCSTMPIREALQRLTVAGLVVHSPNRGVSVAPLGMELYGSTMETYMELLAFSARLAAQQATPAQIAALGEAIDDFASLQVGDDWADKIARTYNTLRLIGEASGNPVLVSIVTTLGSTVVRYAASYYRRFPHVPPILDHFRTILSCIRDGDADGADRAVRRHVAAVRERIGTGLMNPQHASRVRVLAAPPDGSGDPEPPSR